MSHTARCLNRNGNCGCPGMSSETKHQAPDGAVWLCGACGRTDKSRYDVGDESCYMNAVLVDETSIKRDAFGTPYAADAWKEPK